MDIFLKKNKKYAAVCAFAAACCILMIVDPALTVTSVKKAIAIWASDIVPALLPFFICVNFMGITGITEYLPRRIYPFTMSVLSGYPMGAKIIGDMCRTGTIDVVEARRLLSFCSTSGPAFIIGAAGIGMMSSKEAGIIIAVSHYLGAVANGVLFSFIYRGRKPEKRTKTVCLEGSIAEQFTESIVASFKSIGIILIYIILFMFIADAAEKAGAFNMLTSEAAGCLARGFLEMTVGCSGIASAGIPFSHKCILASVIISWGGLSVAGQTVSMLAGTGIPGRYIIVSKLTHSLFAGIIALFIVSVML